MLHKKHLYKGPLVNILVSTYITHCKLKINYYRIHHFVAAMGTKITFILNRNVR